MKKNQLFTCEVHQMKKAPKRISLLGDKSRPESAQHVIEFPGGAIEVSRTSDGNYWAHIHINRGWADDDQPGIRNCVAKVVGSRIGTTAGLQEISNEESVEQIAVLIARA